MKKEHQRVASHLLAEATYIRDNHRSDSKLRQALLASLQNVCVRYAEDVRQSDTKFNTSEFYDACGFPSENV